MPTLVSVVVVQGAVVDAVRPRVGSQSRQPPAQSPPKLNLQRVIVRCKAVLKEGNVSHVRVTRSMKIIPLRQPRRMRTNVGDVESLRSTQCLFDAGVPL